MKKKVLLSMGAFAAAGWFSMANAADIAFKWDSSGRSEVAPAVASANVATFDSVVRQSAESSFAESVRAAYRTVCSSVATALSTFPRAFLMLIK